MAKKKASTPRQYGRQAEGKTIKSLSLETEVAQWAEVEAKKRGVSLSSFINEFLKGSIKLIIFMALIAKLMSDPTDWSGVALAQAAGTGCVWFGKGLAWLVGGMWELGGQMLASL